MEYNKPLFKLDHKGKIRVWSVVPDLYNGSYTVHHGLLEGKKVSKTTLCKEKNVGKANHTNASQQVIKEVKALWLKRRDRECYVEDLEDEPHHIEPMLALDYSKVPNRLDWNDKVYAQAKLDGVRAIYDPNKDHHTLQSRKGKRYPLQHLAHKLLVVQTNLGIDYPLDGEIYLHNHELNRIHGASVTPNGLTPLLDFYIFDIVAPELTYDQRKQILESVDMSKLPLNIKILTAFEIFEDDVQQEHDRIVKAGFEGVMLKGASGLYEKGFRSKYLFKYKNFEEEEFEIADVTPDKDGQGVIQYQHKSKGCFGSRMRGTNASRIELLENKEKYIGKMGTVRFFKYTEYGYPQFPITVAINQDK